MIRLHHPFQLSCGFGAIDRKYICHETDGSAAAVTRGEFVPATFCQINLERAEVSVISTRIERDVLITLKVAVRKPATNKGGKNGPKNGAYSVPGSPAPTMIAPLSAPPNA